jgi:DNA-binding NtrC family response regulator
MNRSIETVPSETMNMLVRYDWPGNIRELQNVIEWAVIVSTGPVLKVPLDDLRSRVPAEIPNGGSASEDPGQLRGVLESAERKQILAALKQTNWVVAAKLCRIGRPVPDEAKAQSTVGSAKTAPLNVAMRSTAITGRAIDEIHSRI